MSAPDLLASLAGSILEHRPDPAVRVRLLRDVLRAPCTDPALAEARRELLESPWVRQLSAEQLPNGSWGRLHSEDTRSGRNIPTTEFAVERGLCLGLETEAPLLASAAAYLTGVLAGTHPTADPPERNNRWTTGLRLFAGATLARLAPTSPALDDLWELWATIASRTFASGDYDPAEEIRTHKELTGASVQGSYLVISNKYALSLLGARPAQLPAEVERTLVSWVWHKPEGIGYLGTPLARLPHGVTPGYLDRWFTSLELLAPFPSWKALARQALDWLSAQRQPAGGWDFGPRPSRSPFLPLSASWRDPQNRANDHSTRALLLLRAFLD